MACNVESWKIRAVDSEEKGARNSVFLTESSAIEPGIDDFVLLHASLDGLGGEAQELRGLCLAVRCVIQSPQDHRPFLLGQRDDDIVRIMLGDGEGGQAQGHTEMKSNNKKLVNYFRTGHM